jgi:glycosyltransferase involved in cell wall biosynthesis
MQHSTHAAFIGSAGIPNRYGGFESFLESTCPEIRKHVASVTVTCDPNFFRDNLEKQYEGIERIFIPLRANGALSIFHDLVAFFAVLRRSTHIVVLGVSGGVFFPIFRFFCWLKGAKLIVNIDGVEWRRSKHSALAKTFLKISDKIAQKFSHYVIFDNRELLEFLHGYSSRPGKFVNIAYPGDAVIRAQRRPDLKRYALSVCRIEPENNIEMKIAGALQSRIENYTLIGNWQSTRYGRKIFQKYHKNSRLSLIDPIYSPHELAYYRENCTIYLHGHSVGGTNPSLVEALFYDCVVMAYDVGFNRETAGNSALYFRSPDELKALINGAITGSIQLNAGVRSSVRRRYLTVTIANAYLSLFARQ